MDSVMRIKSGNARVIYNTSIVYSEMRSIMAFDFLITETK